MTYTAVPDHRIPYDNDGTAVGWYSVFAGVNAFLSGANKIALNDADPTEFGWGGSNPFGTPGTTGVVFFFPEQREVTAWYSHATWGNSGFQPFNLVHGSNDTTNGQDGTWEVASHPSGLPPAFVTTFDWRAFIKPLSFTGGKRTVRVYGNTLIGNTITRMNTLHLYGEKVAGQTPDDIIFIDHDTTPGVEYGSVEDFGDRPLGTTVVRQFRVKNTSPTLTANGVNIQCNDTDFAISTDGINWVVTINIASLGPGAESATLFVRDTTPAPGAALGPRFARIVAIVTSWS